MKKSPETSPKILPNKQMSSSKTVGLPSLFIKSFKFKETWPI